MIDSNFFNIRNPLTTDELAGLNACQHSSDDSRLLTMDELHAISGGVVICYGPSPRPYPGPHDGAPPLPPGGRIP